MSEQPNARPRCHFCGEAVDRNSDKWGHFIGCGCGARGPYAPSDAEAWQKYIASPIAWTNDSQLGFLKNPDIGEIPMAMWAQRGAARFIALYTKPPITFTYDEYHAGIQCIRNERNRVEDRLDAAEAALQSARACLRHARDSFDGIAHLDTLRHTISQEVRNINDALSGSSHDVGSSAGADQ